MGPAMHQDTALDQIEIAKKLRRQPTKFEYGSREAILYNLSLGAKREELQFLYEADPNFQILPTFGSVIAGSTPVPYDLSALLQNYDPHQVLAGEHYLQVLQWPIPTNAVLTAQSHLVDILDKGKDAIVKRGTCITDVDGHGVFYAEHTTFLRGCGGFGGPRDATLRGPRVDGIPQRRPDAVVEERMNEEQAVLYRLFGDKSPIHVDPIAAVASGFKVPISHGMSTFGMAGKHVLARFGPFRELRARFAGPAIPGQTLVTEMWRTKDLVIFQVRIKETGKLCISNAVASLGQSHGAKALL